MIEAARASHPGGDRIRIQHYAVAEDALRVEQLPPLERLEGLHPLAPETVRARFHYRDRPVLHALVLRVYRRPGAFVIPNTLGYEGCVSWVELDEALSTSGALPVLPDDAFVRRRAEILQRLGDTGISRL